LGDLFYGTFEELKDITYQEFLILILSALLEAISDALSLPDEKHQKLVEIFMSFIPLYSLRNWNLLLDQVTAKNEL
jgi:hypothetical protein